MRGMDSAMKRTSYRTAPPSASCGRAARVHSVTLPLIHNSVTLELIRNEPLTPTRNLTQAHVDVCVWHRDMASE